jgi:hypothetical protein
VKGTISLIGLLGYDSCASTIGEPAAAVKVAIAISVATWIIEALLAMRAAHATLALQLSFKRFPLALSDG